MTQPFLSRGNEAYWKQEEGGGSECTKTEVEKGGNIIILLERKIKGRDWVRGGAQTEENCDRERDEKS